MNGARERLYIRKFPISAGHIVLGTSSRIIFVNVCRILQNLFCFRWSFFISGRRIVAIDGIKYRSFTDHSITNKINRVDAHCRELRELGYRSKDNHCQELLILSVQRLASWMQLILFAVWHINKWYVDNIVSRDQTKPNGCHFSILDFTSLATKNI